MAVIPRNQSRIQAVYGKDRVNLNGSPVSGMRWLPSGEHYLVRREGKWQKVHATSGRAEPFFDAEALQSRLQKLPGLDRDLANRMTRQLNSDDSFSTALWEQGGDLYASRLDGSAAKRLTSSHAKDELATLSPNGKRVAFIRDFDLFAIRSNGRGERQLTVGGNTLLRRGKADWVYYEEIYGRQWRAYRWSPDSRRIAFLEFDDSPVKPFIVLDHTPHRLNVENERYPKAGDPIPQVRLGVVHPDAGDVQWIQLDGYSADNLIVTRYGWLPDSKRLFVYVQDRAQRWLDMLLVDVDANRVRRLFREETLAWVDDPGDPHFLADGSFLLPSERDGWRHLYRFDKDGKIMMALTAGEWEVRTIHEVDEAGGWVYLSGTRDSHLSENLYRVQLDGTQLTRLTEATRHHRVSVAPGGRYFIDRQSDLDSPLTIQLCGGDGTKLRTLDTNPVDDLEDYDLGPVELVDIEMRDGFKLPGILVQPPDFQADQKYPVWISTYAGPHAFTVSNSWRGGRIRSHLLAQEGILVLHFDPRSASGRGAVNTWKAYRQLGVSELEDLEDAVDWLAAQPYVDGERIGLGGYSYGGFMASYALTHSTKFHAAFAGAPVTDWRNYDAFYTERYMDTPQENPDGYEQSSVVGAAKNLQGNLLLVHGAMDDNVHLQNTLQLSLELQKSNKDFEMMIYAKSRHGIGSDHFQRLRHDFIRRVMLGP